MSEKQTELNNYREQTHEERVRLYNERSSSTGGTQVSLKEKIGDKFGDVASGKSTVSVNGVAVPYSQITDDYMVVEDDNVVVRHTAVGG